MKIRKASFFEAPDFFLSEWEGVNRNLDAIKVGTVWEIGKSEGGRSIRAVAYGEKEPMPHDTTYSASVVGDCPEAYYDPAQRTKPVLLIIGAIHGCELEGCVSCMNLISVMETGADLRGRRWDALREIAMSMRLVIVPIAQPDGRIRIGIQNLMGGDQDDLYYYSQGVLPNGDILRWPECYRNQPRDLDQMVLLGGMYNDAGVNIQCDDFFAPKVAPETRALIDLVRDETPDCFITLHGCEEGPFFVGPNDFIPQTYRYRQAVVAALVGERHRKEGLKPEIERVVHTTPMDGFSIQNILHDTSGALPLLFEFPLGVEEKPFTFGEIVDVGLTLYDELIRFGLTYGFRPPPA